MLAGQSMGGDLVTPIGRQQYLSKLLSEHAVTMPKVARIPCAERWMSSGRPKTCSFHAAAVGRTAGDDRCNRSGLRPRLPLSGLKPTSHLRKAVVQRERPVNLISRAVAWPRRWKPRSSHSRAPAIDPKQPLTSPSRVSLSWLEPWWLDTALGRSDYSCVGFSIQDSFHLIHVFRPDAHVDFLGRVVVGELAYCLDLDHG